MLPARLVVLVPDDISPDATQLAVKANQTREQPKRIRDKPAEEVRALLRSEAMVHCAVPILAPEFTLPRLGSTFRQGNPRARSWKPAKYAERMPPAPVR
jgi:hypothetical protein